MATHSSILIWRMPWTEKPGGLQSLGSQRVRHNQRDFSSVQFSRSFVSNSLQPHKSKHTKPPCPTPSPEICPSSCPLHQRCHPVISSSDTLFFSVSVSIQLLSCVSLFATPRTLVRQAFLSITNSQTLLKLMPIKLVIPPNHLIF